MSPAKTHDMPFPLGLGHPSTASNPLPQPNQYRRPIGYPLYLGFTWHDLTHVVHQLSQLLHAPFHHHWDVALHLVRYLKGFSHLSLFCHPYSDLTLHTYCDAD